MYTILAKYPWFASNIFDENGNLLFRAGEVIDVDGIKVGVFGKDGTPQSKAELMNYAAAQSKSAMPLTFCRLAMP